MTLMLFPPPDLKKWRLLTSGEGDAQDPEQIARQFGAKLSQALGRDTIVESPSWTSKFAIQQRAVPAMHVGRCFVSGDAAQVHSPASGQGLHPDQHRRRPITWLDDTARGAPNPRLASAPVRPDGYLPPRDALGHSSVSVTNAHYIKPSHAAPDLTAILESFNVSSQNLD
ncbi:FAD-dependent monooxygenase [Subtercola boreus]|uniref:FAD-dependent monooxygenase n=1 Tax=Subtercola boreus TaxID=120213 RepID=UPI001C0ECE92|nr:FAD-dependent monooxygenase [Subtercola boreus]